MPAPETWWILAASYVAGSMAWSARAAAPVPRGAGDPLQPVEADLPAPDDPALRQPLFGRDRLLRTALDVLVGALVAWAALRLAPQATAVSVTWHGYLAAMAAGLGHAFPLWRPLRGGSGAPVLVGGLLVLWPWAAPWVLAAGVGLVLATGSLAAGVVAGLATLPLQAWWTDAQAPRFTFAVVACVLVALRLAPTLRREARGEKPRFSRLRLLVRLRRP